MDVVVTKAKKPVGPTVLVGNVEIIEARSEFHPKKPFVVYRGEKFIARISKKERDMLVQKARLIG